MAIIEILKFLSNLISQLEPGRPLVFKKEKPNRVIKQPENSHQFVEKYTKRRVSCQFYHESMVELEKAENKKYKDELMIMGKGKVKSLITKYLNVVLV